MIKEAIEKILELGKHDVLEENGIRYSNQRLNPIKENVQDIIRVTSLSSLIDIAKNYKNDHFILVESTREVSIIKSLRDKFGRIVREVDVDCRIQTDSVSSGTRYGLEDFILKTQQAFMRTENLEKLLSSVSKISVRQESDLEDDGITQKVGVKKGVLLSEKVAIKNPILLKPYETFPEVKDLIPEREYIFRVHERNGDTNFSLSPIFSNEWDSVTVQVLKKYIDDNLPKENKMMVL